MNRDYQCITHPLLNQDMWVFPHEKLDTIRDIMQIHHPDKTPIYKTPISKFF